ncbi:MAG: hypothetical protein HY051_05435 [Candidatus Aenigmarchaeota archaeon]|nr:hypothetical protein [Candidatus Aenigmarchaeota archaeon]
MTEIENGVRRLKGILERIFHHSAGRETYETAVNAAIENYYRAGDLRRLGEFAEEAIYSSDGKTRARGIRALDRIVKLAEKTEPSQKGRWATDTITDFKGKARKYSVYLPPGYENSMERYPVVYVMHGLMTPINSPSGLKSSGEYWKKGLELDTMLDRLISSGAIHKMIFVMPDMGAMPLRPSGRNEEFLVNTLIPEVDNKYRTVPDKNHRAIDGYSLGARLSIGIASKNPDKFSSAGGHNGTYHGTAPKRIEGLKVYLSSSIWDPLSITKTRRVAKTVEGGGNVAYDQHKMITASLPTPFHSHQMWKRGLEMSFIYHSMNFKRSERSALSFLYH